MAHHQSTTLPKHISRLLSIPFGMGMVVIVVANATTATFMRQQTTVATLQPTVETAPVPSKGDAADDPCIWIHPADPSLSIIIGTDKQGGMGVYNLDGTQIQYTRGIQPNNADLRYNFSLGGECVALVGFSDRSDNNIGVYKVNPATRLLENVEARNLAAGISVYGFCLYHSPSSGKYYCFINSDGGKVEQWELFDNGSGKVDAALVRTFAVGSTTEGCVADDRLGHFYIGEENVAIWKYGAEPNAGDSRTKVDDTASGRLIADIEGLTIYYASDSTGYLIASSQGSNEFEVYERQGINRFLMAFTIVTGNSIDGVTDTDGIDIVNFPLGSKFPFGMFVAQDGKNDNANQNFKLVPWESIAQSVSPALKIDTAWDPRQVGSMVADFTSNVTLGCAPLTVNFTDKSTGPVSSWFWEFGDGQTSTAQRPTHAYTAPGIYTVKLTVRTASCSNTTIKAGHITINAVPVAGFTGSRVSGNTPLVVDFTDQSTGSATSWLWDFGDGGTSTLQNPSHRYTAPGNYTVKLTVANACGKPTPETKVDYITVTGDPIDLALNQPATASGTEASNTPDKAVDGSTSTYWSSGKISSSPNAWLGVDLGLPAPAFNRAVVKWKSSYYAKRYQLQVSDTGGDNDNEWRTVFSTTSGKSGTQDISFAATTARYFRLNMTKENKSSYRLNEIELYSGPSTRSTSKPNAPYAEKATVPEAITLYQSYPNPFNPSTNISFSLPQEAYVTLKIYDLMGEEVTTLVEGRRGAGVHTVIFRARNLSSGVYFCVMQAGEARQVHRLLLMK